MRLHCDGLKTDLYELTMACGYFQNDVKLRATFELFCYKPLPARPYFVACGLEQVVDYILNLRFSDEDTRFLKSLPAFGSAKKDFFDYLKNFRFTGNLWAMPEGEVFFAKEPIIQVEAPIIEAQILETYILSMTHIQSLIATKASRVVQAASSDGIARQVVDFGSRRAHGPHAGILAARAAYIAGCVGTSNVYAAKRFGIPVYGTMAHSFVEAYDTEEEAFSKYHNVFPKNTILLVDTYDTIKAVKKALRFGKALKAVRLDSGDLAVLSKAARRLLDKAGLASAKIIASGNLNEFKILGLVKKKSPIDIFGVGTDMVTSKDCPSLDFTYKLVQVETPAGNIKYKKKTSPGKQTLASRKQVFRKYTKKGRMLCDSIGLFSEKPAVGAKPLLEPIIENGKLVKSLPDIKTIRKRLAENIKRLPGHCLKFKNGRYLKVEISTALSRLK